MTLDDQLAAALASRAARGILRALPPPSSPAQEQGEEQEPELVDFASNDYLSLARSPTLRARVLAALARAPHILGSGGSRLLVNPHAHAALEARLARFFSPPAPAPPAAHANAPSHANANANAAPTAALLFNSGFDANTALFSTLPQPPDHVLYDLHIHASTHDGLRASRLPPSHRVPFAHNDPRALRSALARVVAGDARVRAGHASVFVALESVYSMDGSVAPLGEMVAEVESALPRGNGYVVVDEAHAAGVFGGRGRGMVGRAGLERRVFARLYTFGKALAGTGAVLLVSPLVKAYLVNYARPLIYTTSLSYANVIAADCVFDLLEAGEADQLAHDLLALSAYFLAILQRALTAHRIPPALLALPAHLCSPSPVSSSVSSPSPVSSSTPTPSSSPSSLFSSPSSPTPSSSPPPSSTATATATAPPSATPPPSSPPPAPPHTPTPTPIIPILTPHARALSAALLARGLNARPITWPTVAKGADRIRVCLHAHNSRADVERLTRAVVEWAEGWLRTERGREGGGEGEGRGEGRRAKL